MTRPIYEPDLTNDVASHEFDQSQMFRRPAPASGAASLYASFAQIELSATVPTATTAPLTDLDDFFYVVIDQTDIEVSQRVSDDAWGVQCNTPGMYYIWADVRVPGGITNPVRCEIGSVEGDVAPGVLDQGACMSYIRTSGVSAAGAPICNLNWLTLFKDDTGDWGSLHGGHGGPIRVSVYVRHTEGSDTLINADLNVGLVHPLNEVFS